MQSTLHSTKLSVSLDFIIQLERFPLPRSDFNRLFDAHGVEVRGQPMALDYARYAQLDCEGRLVWVVARNPHTAGQLPPIGYSCHYLYRDMHFDERCAADDLWYVSPNYRRRGLGRQLKQFGHKVLREAGVTRIGDNIRAAACVRHLMEDMGFEAWGTRWVKTFPGSSGS